MHNNRIKLSFPCIKFAKPKGNLLRGWGCKTLLPKGLANVNAHGKEYHHCYIPFLQRALILFTVNPEIFEMALFSLIFANSLPRENKVLANKE